MTDEDKADLTVLSRANEKRKFGIALGARLGQEVVDAFERGIDNQWFTLVDVSPIAAAEGVYRLFRLTDAGVARLAELSGMKTRN